MIQSEGVTIIQIIGQKCPGQESILLPVDTSHLAKVQSLEAVKRILSSLIKHKSVTTPIWPLIINFLSITSVSNKITLFKESPIATVFSSDENRIE